MLLIEAGNVVPLSTLVDATWDAEPPDTAEHQVRKTIAKLRSKIPYGHETILTDGPGYRALVETERLDFLLYSRSLSRARQLLDAKEHERVAEELANAMALWRGPILSGAGGRVLDTASTALEQRHLATAEQLYRLRLAAGEAPDIVGELRALASAHPLHEAIRGQLMLALYQSGQQAAALAVFEQIRELLVSELGIDPGAELTQLHERILRQDPSLARPKRPEPPAPATAHAPAVHVPPAAPAASHEAPHTLPYDVPDFAGRAAELEWISAAQQRSAGSPTILAIDGMGGSGKTALAVHAAHRLAHRFPDGQLYIDLRGFSPHEERLTAFHVEADLLAAAGIPAKEIPMVPSARNALWRSYMRGRRMLLLLDNAASSEQVRSLIPASSDSLVLVTSRPRLTGLDGAEWRSLGVLPEQDSMEFLRRALGAERIAREPDSATELLRLCGRLPLALRIAAARLSNRPSWAIQDLVDRLLDHSRRLDELTIEDRSVASALMLSYQAMPGPQRTALRLLGCHPGHYLDADEAAALLAADVPDAEDTLERLVDVHLVEAVAPNVFTFHDLVRSFVQRTARWQDDEEVSQAVDRLLHFYLDTARSACDQLFPYRRRFGDGPGDGNADRKTFVHKSAALAWLDQHQENLLSSVYLAEQKGRYEHAAWLPRELGFHSSLRGYDTRANEALETGARAAAELGNKDLERLNLMNLAMGHWRLGQLGTAVVRLEEALQLAVAAGDIHSEAECKARMGQAYCSLGKLRRACELAQEACSTAQQIGYTRLEGSSKSTLSQILVRLGRYEDAERAAHEALSIFDSIDEIQLSVDALCYRSQALVGLERHEQALSHVDHAAELCDRLELHDVLPQVLAQRAQVLVRMDRADKARQSAEYALAEATRSVGSVHRAGAHCSAGSALLAVGLPDDAVHHYKLAYELACRMGLRYDEACALRGLGAAEDVAFGQGAGDARRRRSEALLTDMGIPQHAF